ncbi:ABC transporter ATP-binding protein [Bremerella cremea]|uniref:ABC transporter ATP-binding protein n=1 Tax=Bremerella cremea TaxID=1031537 RepID=UPI0031EA28A1
MSNVAISVDGLSKCYQRGTSEPYSRFSELLARLPKALWNRFIARGDSSASSQSTSNPFWALKDLDFSINEGEVVGVIGRNGAGKSTLLKILSRITEPTAGRFGLRGRVGSLLEVGTGFHPELTGAENIYLSGTLLGMSRQEIKRHFDEIVDFAQIEDFLQTPVKRYSSGMYVRLGFAIAAHLQPEILIVDEVLAVGDAQFQKKCLDKMKEVSTQGRTVLFVSHQLSAIRQLTDSCLVLDRGRLRFQGESDQAIRHYLEMAQPSSDDLVDGFPDLNAFRRDHLCGTHVRAERIGICRADDAEAGFSPVIEFGEDFRFECEIESSIETEARMGFSIARVDGSQVTVVWTQDAEFSLRLRKGRQVVRCDVLGLPLAPGKYVSQIGISDIAVGRTYDVIMDYPLLEVRWQAVEDGTVHYPDRRWGGVHWTPVQWSVESTAAGVSKEQRIQ